MASTLVWITSACMCLQCIAMDTRLFRVLLTGRAQGIGPKDSSSSFGIALTSSSRFLSERLCGHRVRPHNNVICKWVNWFRNKSGWRAATSRSKSPPGVIESLVNVWCKPLGRRAARVVGRSVHNVAAGNSRSRSVKVLDWICAMVWSKGARVGCVYFE